MLYAWLAIGASQAEPALQQWSAQGVGFTGIEQWSDAGTAMGGLRGSAAFQRQQALILQASISSEAHRWEGSPTDLHRLDAALASSGRWMPGGNLSAQGSAVSGWSQYTAAASGYLLSSATHRLQLRAGPALRLGDAQLSGLSTSALWTNRFSPTISRWARADIHSWQTGTGTIHTIDADTGMLWQIRPPLMLIGTTGFSSTISDRTDWLCGIPPGGSSIFRIHMTADRRLTAAVGVRAELTADWGLGTLAYAHSRATLGISAQLGRVRAPPPAPQLMQFALSAPEAAAVSVIGSFSGWQPAPMTRSADGTWSLELQLPAGVYEYAYLVDGQPIIPPEATTRQSDGFGGENGVLVVGG